MRQLFLFLCMTLCTCAPALGPAQEPDPETATPGRALEPRAAEPSEPRSPIPAQEPPTSSQPMAVEPEITPARERPPRVGGEEFKELEPGLTLGLGGMKTPSGVVEFKVLRVAPNGHQLDVLAQSPREKITGRTLLAYQKIHGVKAVLSGGFLKSFSPPIPLGMVKTNGQLQNRPIEKTDQLNGVFGIEGSRPRLVKFTDGISFDGWDDCIQAGPLLIDSGRIVIDETRLVLPATKELVFGRFIRSFVAIDRAGHVLLGLTGEISLPDLASVLARSPREGGLDCEAALNLTGHVNSGLVIDAGQTHEVFGDSYTRFPNVIAVRRR